MKIILTFISLTLLFIHTIDAQVGINTNPSSNLILHIDSQNNTTTSSAASQTDDIVIDNEGRLGIGTTTPDADLTIKGSLKISDGTQATGLVLTAKSDGTTHWVADTLKAVVNKLILSITTNNNSPQYNTEYTIKPTSTSSITNTISGASFNSETGIISLPAGYYNISYPATLSSTYDFFSMKMYINNTLFLQNCAYTASIGFNTLYESSSPFTIYFSYAWDRPANTGTALMTGYSPSIKSNICIEKLSF